MSDNALRLKNLYRQSFIMFVFAVCPNFKHVPTGSFENKVSDRRAEMGL